jgi:parallel beta-helix repeat protein
MNPATRKRVAATAVLLAGLALAGPAAAVQCGETIGPNVSVTLSGTLVCDDVAHGLTIVGPASVTLDGLLIVCQDIDQNGATPSSGLRILGRGVRVQGTADSGGATVFCRTGVEVAGDGRHKIEQVIAADGPGAGFAILSDRNTLKRNEASNNSIGFSIQGLDNTLRNNTAENHESHGFYSRGDGTRLTGNLSFGSRWYGFSLYRVSRQRLTSNYASGSERTGFRVDFTEDSAFRKNSAIQNHGLGIDIQGGQRQVWAGNVVRQNESPGFWVNAGQIRLTNNEAIGNGTYDILEYAPGCGTNIWRNNVFGTANRSCVQ